MEGVHQKITELENRIDRLVKTQIGFQSEIAALRDELKRLKHSGGDPVPAAAERNEPAVTRFPSRDTSMTRERPPIRRPDEPQSRQQHASAGQGSPRPDPVGDFFSKHTESARTDLEKFIGENLISKIGILVLIIGIGIGVKYSIDNNLISPLTRVIIAYLFAFGLVGLAVKLKPKYLNFSAALMSGGMATMYFVTYFAYTTYGLIGQLSAFALMAACTVFTVVAALFYNRQVIAHIGLVGAYAVPFLLSSDSGNYLALFSYMAIINAGILAVSVKKYWPSILYTASAFTWLIYGAWFLTRYRQEQHFTFALSFAAVFFAILYSSSLIHRLLKPEFGKVGTSGLVVTNAFIFYGFGYSILDDHEGTSGLLGLYTAAHSALHLAVALVAGRMRNAPADVIQILAVLVLTFASIAIPVQLDGNQVTMAWSVEAAVLFWFGRARGNRLFEYYSYPVMLLATGSMFFDWGLAYLNRTNAPSEFNLQPFANGNFVTALVYIAAFGAIYAISRDREREADDVTLWRPFGYLIVSLALFVLYNAFRTEIGNYFHLRGVAAYEAGFTPFDAELQNNSIFDVIWQINYTVLFLAAMAFVNLRMVHSRVLGYANAILAVGALGVLATFGTALFHELRVNYLAGEGGYGLISIRYASYISAAILTFALYLYSRSELVTERAPYRTSLVAFEAVAYSFWFIAASCELVNSMAQLGIPDATKLGLSIFWGIYALMLIVIGIARNRKHLRVAAIVLIGVTLAKLFFYDVTDLDTIPRTILFVSLGLTLLLISFLYNKYKNLIFGFAGEGEE